MNIELLRQIQDKIRQEPELFEMEAFHSRKKCGTAHCIAGWAQVISGRVQSDLDADEDGRDALGLKQEESDRLFYACEWPSRHTTEDDGGYLQITPALAIARIDHFIQTEGRE